MVLINPFMPWLGVIVVYERGMVVEFPSWMVIADMYTSALEQYVETIQRERKLARRSHLHLVVDNT